jgi:hypothetical protein
MVSQHLGRKAEQTAKRMCLAFAMVGLLAIGGCSPSTDPSANQRVLAAKTELHFDRNKCEEMGANLYKCPASDKPICNSEYAGQVECVRIGPRGGVFVQSEAS